MDKPPDPAASGPSEADAGGKRRIEAAFASMVVLQSVRKHFIKTQPFCDLRIAACFELTAESANLLVTLRDGGAALAFCPATAAGDNGGIANSLEKNYCITPSGSLAETLAAPPHLLLDDGAQLSAYLRNAPPELSSDLRGVVELSETGAHTLRGFAEGGVLRAPAIVLAESQTQQLFSEAYGLGQLVVGALMKAADTLLAGSQAVVIGYGRRGAAIAPCLKGLGANVMVAEIDPVRALKAALDGYRVLSIAEAALAGDVFIATTGGKNVIGREHFEKFKNGVILANAGASEVELDLETLAQICSSHRPIREEVEEYLQRDGRRLYLLRNGGSLASGTFDRRPVALADLVSANVAWCAAYLLKSAEALGKTVYPVPGEIDREVAKTKLETMGIHIDRLTMEQEQFLAHWPYGN